MDREEVKAWREEDRRQRAEQAAALINRVLQELDCVQIPVLVMQGGQVTDHTIRVVARG